MVNFKITYDVILIDFDLLDDQSLNQLKIIK
jgi:hypothetical protein